MPERKRQLKSHKVVEKIILKYIFNEAGCKGVN
jgi:hypothetical protein